MALSSLGENLGYGGARIFGLELTARPRAEPLWFLRSLFVYILISPLLVAALRRFPKVFLAGFFALAVYCRVAALPAPLTGFLWRFVDLFGLFYFAVGIALRLYAPAELKLSAKFAAFCAVVGFSLVALQVASKLCGFRLPINLVPFMTPFVAVAVWAIVPAIELPECLKGVGFPIYLLHFFFLEAWWSVEGKVFGAPVWTHILVWPVVLVVSAACANLMRRVAPKTASILFGGR